MKKFLTSVMLFLFLLNVLGFYGIFLGWQFKSAQDANRNLDEERYSTSDEVTFKVPLSVPYSSDSQDFERVSGEFEYGGDVYRLLKQRYRADTLTIICVKDHEAREINQAMGDYVKTFTDKPMNSKHESSKSLKSFCKDYLTTGISLESQASGWKNGMSYSIPNQLLPSFDLSRTKRPPKQVFFV